MNNKCSAKKTTKYWDWVRGKRAPENHPKRVPIWWPASQTRGTAQWWVEVKMFTFMYRGRVNTNELPVHEHECTEVHRNAYQQWVKSGWHHCCDIFFSVEVDLTISRCLVYTGMQNFELQICRHIWRFYLPSFLRCLSKTVDMLNEVTGETN